MQGELKRRDIGSQTGISPRGFSRAGVHSDFGVLDAELVVYTAGLSGPSWLAEAELPCSAGGFISADDYCAVNGLERVFVAGDAGSFPGPVWSPQLAHMAQIQANVAAANLHAAPDGETPTVRLHHVLACVIDTLDGGIMLYRDDA